MMQAYGDLYQPLIELPGWTLVFRPQFFPSVMGFEELTIVKEIDALKKARIEGRGIHDTCLMQK